MSAPVPSNRIRSGFSKGLLIFLIIILVSTGGFLVPLILLDVGTAFRVIGFIFCGGFFLFASFLLIDTLFHYTVVQGDEIINVVLFSKKRAKMSDITRIEHGPGFYQIYVKDRKFCALNSDDGQTAAMLHQIERHGFDLGKITKVSK